MIYPTLPHHIILHHTTSYYIILNHTNHATQMTKPHHDVPDQSIVCHTLPYHAIPYHTILCNTTQETQILPYHITPYPTLQYHGTQESQTKPYQRTKLHFKPQEIVGKRFLAPDKNSTVVASTQPVSRGRSKNKQARKSSEDTHLTGYTRVEKVFGLGKLWVKKVFG